MRRKINRGPRLEINFLNVCQQEKRSKCIPTTRLVARGGERRVGGGVWRTSAGSDTHLRAFPEWAYWLFEPKLSS